jgi:hypothetical protein
VIREIEVWIWGCWPAGAVHLGKPGSHRSDGCLSPVWPVPASLGFCSGERLGVFAVVPCCCCLEFGSVWSSVSMFGVLGLYGWDRSDRCVAPARPVWSYFCGSRQFSPAGTGLTGGAHWPDRCRSVNSNFVFRCVLGYVKLGVGSRFSSTPVAAWTWPTWVVSRRRVSEAVFVLLESPYPSRRIFIGSDSLPTLWFAVSVLQLWCKYFYMNCFPFMQNLSRWFL